MKGKCGDCGHAVKGNGMLVCWANGCGMVTGEGGSCPKYKPKEGADGKHMPAEG